MQLTCPACGAHYEIDDGLIPPEGRSVQCSVCENVWREAPVHPRPTAPDAAPDRDAAARPAVPEGAPPGNAPEEAGAPRRPLADKVRAILREEADREVRVRKERGLIDIQPDLGLPPKARRGGAADSEALPDPDKINETLRAASRRSAELHGSRDRRPGRGGFVAGLVVGLCVIGLAALLYVTAPRIADAVPDAGPALQVYVAAIDDIRWGLDRAVSSAVATVSGLLE